MSYGHTWRRRRRSNPRLDRFRVALLRLSYSGKYRYTYPVTPTDSTKLDTPGADAGNRTPLARQAISRPTNRPHPPDRNYAPNAKRPDLLSETGPPGTPNNSYSKTAHGSSRTDGLPANATVSVPCEFQPKWNKLCISLLLCIINQLPLTSKRYFGGRRRNRTPAAVAAPRFSGPLAVHSAASSALERRVRVELTRAGLRPAGLPIAFRR